MAIGVWLTALLLVWWPHFAPVARRGWALGMSGAGLVLLLVGLSSEGAREAPTVAGFLFGSPYVTEQAAASAGLPYYVATAVCLFFGTVGLALPDDSVLAIRRHWLLLAIALSLGVTTLRFALEKVAAPPEWTRAVGITWLPPVFGAWFAAHVREEGGGWRRLVWVLVVYALAVRGAVAALMVVATGLDLGSHYDVRHFVTVRTPGGDVMEFEPGSLRQILTLGIVPQLVVWPIFTVLTGLAGAAVLGAPLRRRLFPHPVPRVSRRLSAP